MQKVDKDPDAQSDLIKELREKPRAVTDTEDAMLLQRQIDLQNEYSKASESLKQAKEKNQPEQVEEHKIRVAKLSDDLLDIYNINKEVGTETGRGLGARRMMANEDYSLAAMETRLRSAKGGEELNDPEKSQVAEISNRLNEAQAKLDEYQRMMASDSTKPTYSDFVVKVANKIIDNLDKQADLARQRIKERSGRVSAGIDPTLLG